MKLTQQQWDELTALYESGLTMEQAAAQFGVTAGAVSYYFKRTGISAKSRAVTNRKTEVNEDAFSSFTPEALYWAGFLMADGCIETPKSRSPVVQCSLQKRDKAHVEKLRDFLGSTRKLEELESKSLVRGDKVYTTAGQYRIKVTSSKLADDLAKYGVVPRKSLTAEASEQAANSRDFWRGLVDGDGYIGVSGDRPMFKLTGSRRILEQFSQFVGRKLTMFPAGSAFSVGLGCKPAVDLVRRLYKGADLALERKKETAERIMSFYEQTY